MYAASSFYTLSSVVLSFTELLDLKLYAAARRLSAEAILGFKAERRAASSSSLALQSSRSFHLGMSPWRLAFTVTSLGASNGGDKLWESAVLPLSVCHTHTYTLIDIHLLFLAATLPSPPLSPHLTPPLPNSLSLSPSHSLGVAVIEL